MEESPRVPKVNPWLNLYAMGVLFVTEEEGEASPVYRRLRMRKLSEFGKALRKLRIDRDEKMKDMADVAGVSVSFWSAVETGAKSVPMEKVEKIISHYDLKGAEAMALRRLAANSKQEVRIRVRPESR